MLALSMVFAHPPDGWQSLANAPNIRLDIRYATADNFVGERLHGYGHPDAWLRDTPFAGISAAADCAREHGLELVVFDAYRPQRASLHMVRWAETSGQTALLRQGYIAPESGHNKGHTVDVTLARRGVLVEMGTPYDHFGVEAHIGAVQGQAEANRVLLRTCMERGGFVPYRKEWWHFSHASGPYTPLDLPYHCPHEGKP